MVGPPTKKRLKAEAIGSLRSVGTAGSAGPRYVSVSTCAFPAVAFPRYRREPPAAKGASCTSCTSCMPIRGLEQRVNSVAGCLRPEQHSAGVSVLLTDRHLTQSSLRMRQEVVPPERNRCCYKPILGTRTGAPRRRRQGTISPALVPRWCLTAPSRPWRHGHQDR